MNLRSVLIVIALAATACGAAPRSAPSEAASASQPPSLTATTASSKAPPQPAESPSASPTFDGAVARIDDATRARMTFSWRQGCPTGMDQLRLVSMNHWGFDGRIHRGEMVVNTEVTDDVLRIFRKLFDARFPIRRMELVDAYGGDDDRSMAADNTSAFNCRSVTGHAGVWSEHSYGWAIDLNPRENPYVSGSFVAPPEGVRFTDRSLDEAGMVRPGDVVVRAFSAEGWTWGGTWSSLQDYQHFSLTGR